MVLLHGKEGATRGTLQSGDQVFRRLSGVSLLVNTMLLPATKLWTTHKPAFPDPSKTMVEKDPSPLVSLALESVFPIRVNPRVQHCFHLPCPLKALRLLTWATWMVWGAVVEACLVAALMALVVSKVLAVVVVDIFEVWDQPLLVPFQGSRSRSFRGSVLDGGTEKMFC